MAPGSWYTAVNLTKALSSNPFERPPEAVCFYLAGPTVPLRSLTSGLSALFSPMIWSAEMAPPGLFTKRQSRSLH